MNKEQTLDPELRFDEYEGRSEHSCKSKLFEDIFVFSTGMNIKQAEASPDFATPCVRYGELYHMYNEVITTVVNRTNIDQSELKFSDGDEILLPSAGEDPLDIGSASALTIKGVAIGRTINILKPKEAGVYDQKFASYYINQRLRKKISTLARGASISNVYNSDLKKLEIVLPTLPEQRKIADFLTAVDGRIQQLSQKNALLQDYKKGVMQQLFTQAIRFKDEHGNEFPEWEENRLGHVGIFKSGVGFSESEQGGSSGIPFFKVSDMNLPGNEVEMNSANHYVTAEQISKNRYKVIDDDAVLFAKVGAAVFLERKRIARRFLMDNNMMAYIPSFQIKFAKFLFATIRLSKYAQVGALPSYNASDLATIRVSIPSPDEQTKIANVLTAIDRKIESVAQQIELTQTFKRGLLQQMFV